MFWASLSVKLLVVLLDFWVLESYFFSAVEVLFTELVVLLNELEMVMFDSFVFPSVVCSFSNFLMRAVSALDAELLLAVI